MYPFIEQYDESQDVALVLEACKGSKQAMEKLVGLHKYLHFFTSQAYAETNIGDQLIKTLLLDPQIKQLFHLN